MRLYPYALDEAPRIVSSDQSPPSCTVLKSGSYRLNADDASASYASFEFRAHRPQEGTDGDVR